MKRSSYLSGCLGLALALSACSANVHLARRRADYQAVLEVPAQVQAALAAKTALYDGALTRTSTPDAAPYPALADGLRTMRAQAAVLEGSQAEVSAFEGVFDAFAALHPVVTPKRPEEWASYQALDRRFQPLAGAIQGPQNAFNADAARFDALAQDAHVFHLDAAALDAALDAVSAQMNRGLKAMERRVGLDRQAVDFDAWTSMDPVLKKQRRQLLDSMQAHLFRTEDLARRALGQADAVRASRGPGDLWTGPGLPDDGSALAKLWSQRDAFHRRRVEFKALADSFDALGQQAP